MTFFETAKIPKDEHLHFLLNAIGGPLGEMNVVVHLKQEVVDWEELKRQGHEAVEEVIRAAQRNAGILEKIEIL